MLRHHRRPGARPPSSPIGAPIAAPIASLVAAALACATVALGSPSRTRAALPGSDAVDRVVTALQEVQAGSVNGLDYFTIAISAGAVGPLRCRGRVLRVDVSGEAAAERRAAMEHVALAAMLDADAVLVTVPLSPRACRDGRPTFTRLDLLPASP